VELQGRLFALILRHELNCEGTRFFTSPDNPIQLGILQHKRGTEIRPHVHLSSTRKIESIQEVLHIECGMVEADFYGVDGVKLDSRTLREGDTILLLDGGHGFRIIDDARIVEVKQGPYRGIEEDKQCLGPK
jgi:hypothetical protein